MAGVGLRSEQQFDKDSNERAKRDLGKDLGDMEVDGGKDRPAKDKPIETTPQIAKKTKKDEAAEKGSDPPQTYPSQHPKVGRKHQALAPKHNRPRDPGEVEAKKLGVQEENRPQFRRV